MVRWGGMDGGSADAAAGGMHQWVPGMWSCGRLYVYWKTPPGLTSTKTLSAGISPPMWRPCVCTCEVWEERERRVNVWEARSQPASQ